MAAWAPVAYGVMPRVVINEFSYDDSSTDDAEFVELYNASGVAVDISGWQLRASNTVGPPDDNNADYTIPGPAGGQKEVEIGAVLWVYMDEYRRR